MPAPGGATLLQAAALGALEARFTDWIEGALSDDAFASRLREMAEAAEPAPAPAVAEPAPAPAVATAARPVTPASVAAARLPAQPAPALPLGWAPVWDATHGRCYYYHASSGETRWEMPP
ncbi:hypothetical protein M885DRAFT_549595 [Pelagophyceae sp. CCMP2097]|nr:hypothetical protein M885DRAFT_549595 [Pelagophyceae sp. CCMP2097]